VSRRHRALLTSLPCPPSLTLANKAAHATTAAVSKAMTTANPTKITGRMLIAGELTRWPHFLPRLRRVQEASQELCAGGWRGARHALIHPHLGLAKLLGLQQQSFLVTTVTTVTMLIMLSCWIFIRAAPADLICGYLGERNPTGCPHTNHLGEPNCQERTLLPWPLLPLPNIPHACCAVAAATATKPA
jgi:hypothetical protein